MKMKNILVSTYGITWYLMTELLGFTNPGDLPFYADHPDKMAIDDIRKRYGIEPVSEVWIITSADPLAQECYSMYAAWHRKHLPQIGVHSVSSSRIGNLRSTEDCRPMRDLIFRTVFAVHAAAAGGEVILSMVGGYKTMGADVQEASQIFGCTALLHIFTEGAIKKEDVPPPDSFETTLPHELLTRITPVVVSGRKSRAAYLYKSQNVTADKFPIVLDGDSDAGTRLLDTIAKYQNQAEVVLSNFAQTESRENSIGNFRALAGLHPRIIDDLKSTILGVNAANAERELAWLRRLPKAELHCHFGGILSPAEMIAVAGTETAAVDSLVSEYAQFGDYLVGIRHLVESSRVTELRKRLRDKQKIRKPFDFVPEPLGVCGLLLQFQGHAELLEQVIFNDYTDPEFYQSVGIEEYEKLGDLQGSALMQSENCIRAACRILLEHCRADNVRYMELRCSPINYTRGSLSGEDVVRIMLEELAADEKDVYTALLFIASRHGRMSNIYRHIELTQDLFDAHERIPLFLKHFVGFDLAGTEDARSPKELREAFEPLHKRCLYLTIHAGETAKTENIWEAVYYLNADRIGHGLKLLEQPDLLKRLIDRRIAVEMCPSSNFQICKFKDVSVVNSSDYPQYPLTEYLKSGLRVTVNTDNPGISRTDISFEFLKAARMSPGGISKWDVLQLINNSFNAAFVPFDTRWNLIREAEKTIMEQIEADYGA